jgi:transcriptional regulator with XRE-family HTH domain
MSNIKQCTVCKEWLFLSAFHKDPKGKYGVRAICKMCYSLKHGTPKSHKPEKVVVCGRTIKILRENRHIRQDHIAEKLGRHPSYMHRIETEIILPTREDADIIVKCLGLESVEELRKPMEMRMAGKPKPRYNKINWKAAYRRFPDLLDRIRDEIDAQASPEVGKGTQFGNR